MQQKIKRKELKFTKSYIAGLKEPSKARIDIERIPRKYILKLKYRDTKSLMVTMIVIVRKAK